jgi:hypothetical protein
MTFDDLPDDLRATLRAAGERTSTPCRCPSWISVLGE